MHRCHTCVIVCTFVTQRPCISSVTLTVRCAEAGEAAVSVFTLAHTHAVLITQHTHEAWCAHTPVGVWVNGHTSATHTPEREGGEERETDRFKVRGQTAFESHVVCFWTAHLLPRQGSLSGVSHNGPDQPGSHSQLNNEWVSAYTSCASRELTWHWPCTHTLGWHERHPGITPSRWKGIKSCSCSLM